MPKHIVRLIVLIAAFGILAYAAKRFFTADSFFQYGHYRGNAVAEIASAKPKYQGAAACESCHAVLYAAWSKGVHNSAAIGKIVKCEVCHGAAAGQDDRGKFEYSPTGPDHPRDLKLVTPADSRKLCTLCHEKIPARPVEQRQIVVLTHSGTQQCTACHNPHSPKELTGTASASPANRGDAVAGRAKSSACAACHGVDGVSAGLPAPNLASQKEAYLVDALKAYRAHTRDNPVMTAMSGALSDIDIDNLAAYFSNSRCKAGKQTAKPASPETQAKASKCTACHGVDGISVNPAWPNLAGQSRDYLADALKAYRSGRRNNPIMAGITKELNDDDIEQLAANYANVNCK